MRRLAVHVRQKATRHPEAKRARVTTAGAVAAAVLAVTLAGQTVGCADASGPPQRFILVTIDTLRADHLAAYGYPRGVSPFLDGIAEESLVFETAISSCSHTSPSHASIFTSLQPAQHRVVTNGEELDDRLVTIAEVLSEAGYSSAAFTPVLFLSGLSAGFDEFSVSDGYEPAPQVLDRAAAWFEARSPDERAFAWIHLYDVHEWMEPKHLDRSTLAWVQEHAELQRNRLRRWLQKHHGLPEDADTPRRNMVGVINRYDGQLLAVDRALESFFNHLDQHDLLRDTVVILTADHGEGLGNHDLIGHGKYIYEEQIRVPLLIWSPDGRLPTGRRHHLVRLVDIAPTMAELTATTLDGQPIPVDGRSLLPIIEDPSAPWVVEEAFAQRRPADEKRLGLGWSDGEVFSYRRADTKLIIDTTSGCEIFDLEDDPFELENLCRPALEEHRLWIEDATRRFELLQAQGAAFTSGVASPEVIEELKALGYL